jgi:hypothetical protein
MESETHLRDPWNKVRDQRDWFVADRMNSHEIRCFSLGAYLETRAETALFAYTEHIR